MRFLTALFLCWVNLCYSQIVTVPIQGAPGLSVTVGVGANALPLRDIRNNPAAVNITTWDDSYNHVPLGFNFPFFGRTFTDSWAATNGYVTFVDPAVSGLGGGCCSGVNLSTTTDPRYNYTIYGIHTDLYSWNGQNQWYLRELGTNGAPSQMTYGWYNLSQCCSSEGGNSFEIKITSSGTVDTRIAGAMVNWNPVTSGMAGDLTKGEYYQYYHGNGLNIVPGSANIFSWNTAGGFTGSDPCIINPLSSPACPGYQQAYLTQQCTVNALFDPSCPGYAQANFTYQCSINPLYNQTCPGYDVAYFNQQCGADPLYNNQCPGYAQAFYNQQCAANPLYDSGCPGYATAYFSQQCSLNPLYDTGCPGYQQAYFNQQCTQNPLYNNRCPGYATAYFNQQCSLNPLYNNQCPGYGQAYFNQQCSLNPLYNANCTGYSQAYHNQQCSRNPLYAQSCPGYAQAFYNQQCTLNSLYDKGCPGYATAYFNQQCTLNSLYDKGCPNYAQAYFDQQCSLNGLYDTKCPNYGAAYATQQALSKQNTPATQTTIVTQPATTQTTSPASVAVVSDPTVNAAVTNNSTAAAPSASPASVATAVPLVQQAPQASSPATTTTTNTSSSSSTSTTTQQTEQKQTAQPTRAQQLQQARVEAAKREAAAKGNENMKEAAGAKTMEQQVATQGLIISAMGYNAAFSAYENIILKDVQFYKSREMYPNQTPVDNRRALWGLSGPSEQRFEQMRDQQYK